MKCKICSDVSAKMLLLSPVQNNIVFTYHFFFKNSEKCPKNLIPKMWLLSSQLCKYNGLYFPRGFSLRFPMQWNLKEVCNKIQLWYLSQLYFKYVLHYFYGHWKAKRQGRNIAACDVNCMANAAVANCVKGFLHCREFSVNRFPTDARELQWLLWVILFVICVGESWWVSYVTT